MVTIKGSDVFTNMQGIQPRVLAALADIGRQRLSREEGKRLRKVQRAIDTYADDVSAEYKRLLVVYAKRNDDGEPVEVKTDADLADIPGFTKAVQELMDDTVEIEGLPESMLSSFSLLGSTWSSPLIEEDEATPNPKKEEPPAPASENAGE